MHGKRICSTLPPTRSGRSSRISVLWRDRRPNPFTSPAVHLKGKTQSRLYSNQITSTHYFNFDKQNNRTTPASGDGIDIHKYAHKQRERQRVGGPRRHQTNRTPTFPVFSGKGQTPMRTVPSKFAPLPLHGLPDSSTHSTKTRRKDDGIPKIKGFPNWAVEHDKTRTAGKRRTILNSEKQQISQGR